MDDSNRNKSTLFAKLEASGISRRDFIKYCGGLVAALSLPRCGDDAATTLEEAAGGKPAVIWLNAQDCNGCSINFLNLEEDSERGTPSIASVILDTISLRYHEAVMAGSGDVAEGAKHDAIEEGGYILVVEGSIPDADDRYCLVGGESVRETLQAAAANAAYIVALGSCATTGGVVKDMVTVGKPVSDYVPDKTVINLPMCPANGEHLLLTIVHLLTEGQPPELDSQGRPVMFFEDSVHLHCVRLPAFADGNFLTDWNDPAQKDYCLLEMGCRGPFAQSDCPTRKFNGGLTMCTEAGAPCQACAESSYYDGTPIYKSTQ